MVNTSQPKSSSITDTSDVFRAIPNELLEKYNVTGPRYTSYPTAPVWTEEYTADNHREHLIKNNADGISRNIPLALYAHLPFCESRCLFCGCNVVITRNRESSGKYLDYLFREIDMITPHVDLAREVVQLHWGGGTPTYLYPEEMEKLFRFQQEQFKFSPDAEIAIEVDPRVTSFEHLDCLKELGFNRISLGVQDVNPVVQEAIHRIQPKEMNRKFFERCRDTGFDSINLDLIYGLPHQTVESFSDTLTEILDLSPDRVALYNYAHVPWLAPHQKAIPENSLPSGEVKFQIFQMAIRRFMEAGYIYIGMDHFAKPDDELSLAIENGSLHRNFMGYTVLGGTKTKEGRYVEADMISVGTSAISGFGNVFSQNLKNLTEYYAAIDNKTLPIHRGYVLSNDDELRRQVIKDILCREFVNYKQIESQFSIEFEQYFKDELKTLEKLAADNLIEFNDNGFSVLPLGRIFNRNIAMPFDAYLKKQLATKEPTFSKTL